MEFSNLLATRAFGQSPTATSPLLFNGNYHVSMLIDRELLDSRNVDSAGNPFSRQPAPSACELGPSLACPGLENSLKLIQRWELTHLVQLNRAANSAVRVPSSHGGSRWFESSAAHWTYGNSWPWRREINQESPRH